MRRNLSSQISKTLRPIPLYGFPNLRSCTAQYITGTIMTVISAISMPPNEGMAMGIMMSAPLPVEVSTGINARMDEFA